MGDGNQMHLNNWSCFGILFIWCIQMGDNTMPKRKDISNDLKRTIIAAHLSRKDYKVIFKQFKVCNSTVRMIIYKWETFKTIDSLHIRICNAQRNCKNPRVILGYRLELAWTDTTKVEISGHNAQCNSIKHSISAQMPHTSCQASVMEGWWFQLILQPQDLGNLQSDLKMKSSKHQSILLSNVRPSFQEEKLALIGSCNRTKNPSTNLQQNGWKRKKKSRCCNEPVNVQTASGLKGCA